LSRRSSSEGGSIYRKTLISRLRSINPDETGHGNHRGKLRQIALNCGCEKFRRLRSEQGKDKAITPNHGQSRLQKIKKGGASQPANSARQTRAKLDRTKPGKRARSTGGNRGNGGMEILKCFSVLSVSSCSKNLGLRPLARLVFSLKTPIAAAMMQDGAKMVVKKGR
jgi:hypothetical protein